MIDTNLGQVSNGISRFSWKDCVYIKSGTLVSPSSSCLVIDGDEAELGTDGFTPWEAEKRGMAEFLSIHDLQGVIENLQHHQTDPSADALCVAAVYYFENDAFLPPDMLSERA
jgi:hypothetical protein